MPEGKQSHDKPTHQQWEALRQTMVDEQTLPDVPLADLDDHSTMLLENRMSIEVEASPWGGVAKMLDSFEDELKTARSFDSVHDLMVYLETPIQTSSANDER